MILSNRCRYFWSAAVAGGRSVDQSNSMMLPHGFHLLRKHLCRVRVVSVIALSGASLPVRAEVHIEGDVTAVRLVAKQAQREDVIEIPLGLLSKADLPWG
jgi:hypothetical protein